MTKDYEVDIPIKLGKKVIGRVTTTRAKGVYSYASYSFLHELVNGLVGHDCIRSFDDAKADVIDLHKEAYGTVSYNAKKFSRLLKEYSA